MMQHPPTTSLLPPAVPAEAPPPRAAYHEYSRALAAAHAARRLYPGAVGEIVAREITAYAETGYLCRNGLLMARVIADILSGTPDRS